MIFFTILLLASCSYRPTFSDGSRDYGYKEYQDCIDSNPEDKTKCDMLKPDYMEPNLSEHKERNEYH